MNKKTYLKLDETVIQVNKYQRPPTKMIIDGKKLRFPESHEIHDMFHSFALSVMDEGLKFLLNDSSRINIKIEEYGNFSYQDESSADYVEAICRKLYDSLVVSQEVDGKKYLKFIVKNPKNKLFSLEHNSPEGIIEGQRLIILEKSAIIDPNNKNQLARAAKETFVNSFLLQNKESKGYYKLKEIFESSGYKDFSEYFLSKRNSEMIKDIKNYFENNIVSPKLQVTLEFSKENCDLDFLGYLNNYPDLIEVLNYGILGPKNSYIEDDKYYYYPITEKTGFLENLFAKVVANNSVFGNKFNIDEELTIQSNFNNNELNNLFDGKYGKLKYELKKINHFDIQKTLPDFNKKDFNSLSEGKYEKLLVELIDLKEIINNLKNDYDINSEDSFYIDLVEEINNVKIELEYIIKNEIEKIQNSEEFKKLYLKRSKGYGYSDI